MKQNTLRSPMLSGNITKNLIIFALPLIASNVLQSLYNAADTIVLGKFAGKIALAAVGATGSPYNLILNIFIGISTGAGVITAQAFGGDRRQDVIDAIRTSAAVSLIIGVAVGLVGYIFTPDIMRLMDTPFDVMPGAVLYMRIIFIGTPALVVFNFGAAILRSLGDNKRPFIFLSITGLLNIILNLIFVIAFKLDVAGVAAATVISQYVSAVLVWIVLIKSNDYYAYEIKKTKINFPIFAGMLKIGVPSGLQMAMYNIANVIIQVAVNDLGTDLVAASSASSRITELTYTAFAAIAQSSLVFAGQNYGAGQYKRIKQLFVKSTVLIIAVGIVVGVGATLLRYPLLKLIVDDESVIKYGAQKIVILCIPYFICGLYENTIGIVRGMGKSLVPMLVSVFGICVTRLIWIFTVFAHYHTFSVLMLNYPVSYVVTAAAEMIVYFIYAAKLPPDSEV